MIASKILENLSKVTGKMLPETFSAAIEVDERSKHDLVNLPDLIDLLKIQSIDEDLFIRCTNLERHFLMSLVESTPTIERIFVLAREQNGVPNCRIVSHRLPFRINSGDTWKHFHFFASLIITIDYEFEEQLILDNAQILESAKSLLGLLEEYAK